MRKSLHSDNIGKQVDKRKKLDKSSFSMVRITGLEPACPCEHMDLNHTRLPIPPYPHRLNIIPQLQRIVKRFYNIF